MSGVLSIHIRPANPLDFDAILALQATALQQCSPSYTPGQINSLIRSQAQARSSEDETIWVAERGGKLVGFACLVNGAAMIGGVYVHPEHNGQGIGRTLLLALEPLALERGQTTLMVNASADTRYFYEKCGYRFIRPSGFHSEGRLWVDTHRMEKVLRETTLLNQLGCQIRRLSQVVKRICDTSPETVACLAAVLGVWLWLTLIG